MSRKCHVCSWARSKVFTYLVILLELVFIIWSVCAMLNHTMFTNQKACVLNFEQNGWNIDNTTTWKMLEKKLACSLEPGGRYRPETYDIHDDVIVLVPYRNREEQLKAFIRYMHPYLQRKQLAYRIVVVEMVTGEEFNRGFLFNVGFLETIKSSDRECFVFHDVDLLPENINTPYNCQESPIQLSSAVDKDNYRLVYKTCFRGVMAMRKEQYYRVNGFSNQYFGWGSEDDDFYRRLTLSNLARNRASPEEGRYHTVPHIRPKQNPLRMKLLKTMESRLSVDGLNNMDYQILKHELKPLYTWMLVVLDASDTKTFGKYNSLLHEVEIEKGKKTEKQMKKKIILKKMMTMTKNVAQIRRTFNL